MPRYFFDLINAHESRPDREGVDVEGETEALAGAFTFVEDLRCDPGALQKWADWSLAVRDEAGQTLITIPIRPASDLT